MEIILLRKSTLLRFRRSTYRNIVRVTTMGWIRVVMFLSSCLSSAVGSVSDLDIKTGTFQILQKHPQLQKCADSILQEDRYVGCRVYELTGQCQGLIYSWGLNQTIEQGYAYAKKLSVQESFLQRPFVVERNNHSWTIPVVFSTGTQIDISMAKWNIEPIPGELGVFLTNASDGENGHEISFAVWAYETMLSIYERIGDGTEGLDVTREAHIPIKVASWEMLKFTFVAQPYSVEVFFDDEAVTTFNLSTPAHVMRKIGVSTPRSRALIHSLKFTAK